MMTNYATSEQPMPTNDGSDVQRMVIADIEARRLVGIRKYGVPLGVHNGRDHLMDAYQEVLDLAVYIRAEIERRNQQKWSNFREQGVNNEWVYTNLQSVSGQSQHGRNTADFGSITVSAIHPSGVFDSSQPVKEFGE